jgi:hypothetical protein
MEIHSDAAGETQLAFRATATGADRSLCIDEEDDEKGVETDAGAPSPASRGRS